MQQVAHRQPGLAYAFRRLPFADQLQLTLELLQQHDWPKIDEAEALPGNVVRFRRRP